MEEQNFSPGSLLQKALPSVASLLLPQGIERNYGWFAFHIKFKGCAPSLGMRISARNGGLDVSCQLSRLSLDALSVMMLSCLPHLLWLAVWKAASFPKSRVSVSNSSQMSWFSTGASPVTAEFLFSVLVL